MTRGEFSKKRYAYYAPDWIWPEKDTDYMKQMLFFFDGVAMSLPRKYFEMSVEQSPVLAQPLLERGLLINADPAEVLDSTTSDTLTEAVQEVADALDGLSKRGVGIARSHLVSPRSASGSKAIENMIRRGIIERPFNHLEDDLVYVSAEMRVAVLYLYAQALHTSTNKRDQGPTIDPVGRSSYWARPDKKFIASLSVAARADRLSSFDDTTEEIEIPLDLSKATLDDILEFREANASDLRHYLKTLKAYAHELAESENPEAVRKERAQEIEDYNANLRSKTRHSKSRAVMSFGISAMGATWTLKTGDPGGAIFALLSAAAGIPRNEAAHEITSYSYLAKIQRRFSYS
jgi:hypothetical protein